MNRRKSAAIVLGVTAVLAGAAVYDYATTPDPDYAGLCVDPATNLRLEDTACPCPEDGFSADDGTVECDDVTASGGMTSGHTGGVWHFVAFNRSVPAVGAAVSNTVTTPPAGHSFVTGGIPRAGGVVNATTIKGGTTTLRGGFGGHGFAKSGG